MAGSGVNEENATTLVSRTGVAEIHFSATTFRESEMLWQNNHISGMGSVKNTEFVVRTVNPTNILNIRKLIEKAV